VSVVTTSSRPGGKASTAASSVRPRAPGWLAASGARYRAMSSNSPGRRVVATRPEPGFLGPHHVRDPIEHTIYERCFAGREEVGGHIDIFLDDHARGHVAARQQLIGSGPEDRPQDHLDPREITLPARQRRAQRLVD